MVDNPWTHECPAIISVYGQKVKWTTLDEVCIRCGVRHNEPSKNTNQPPDQKQHPR